MSRRTRRDRLVGCVLSGLIYGVSRTDPATFVAVAVLVAVVAVFACLIPAGWVTRIDPVVALRTE